MKKNTLVLLALVLIAGLYFFMQQQKPAVQPPAEAPKAEAPAPEAPKQEEPKAEAPAPEAPKQEEPKAEAPAPEAPKQEEPKAEAPAPEAPKEEEPKAEAPAPEAPKQEEPKAEAPEAAAVVAPVAAAVTPPSGDPIKIGYLAILTGDGSTWGQHEREGALIRIREINEAGGLLGRPVELICYDVRGRQEDAIQAARRLVHEDKVVAIGGANYSGLNIAARPIVSQGKVALVGSAVTNPGVTVDPKTGEVYPYMFRICYTDPYQGKVMADYLFSKLNVKSAAVITDIGSDYSEGLKEFFLARAKELNGDVKGVWAFRSGDVDFRAQLTEMKASGAEAVALPILYKEMGLIIKQAAELGWKPIFIGGDGYSPSIHEIAGDTMEGSYWVYSMNLTAPELVAFNEKFKKEYGRDAFELSNAVFGYDIVSWIADSITRAGIADGTAVRDAIEDTKELPLVHFTLTVDKATHNPLNKPAAIMVWHGDKLDFLEMWAPQDKF